MTDEPVTMNGTNGQQRAEHRREWARQRDISAWLASVENRSGAQIAEAVPLATVTPLAPLASPALLPAARVASGPILLTSLPVTVNLRLYQGDDFAFLLDVASTAGEPVDLTAGTVRSHIRSSPAAADIAGQFEIYVQDATIVLHLPSVVSAALPLISVYDTELTFDGWVTTLAAGTITLTAEITK